LNTPDSISGYPNNDKPIGIIILAAGESSRLGKAKQLLKHRDGQTLISHTCQLAIATGIQPILLVLGAHKEIILEEVQGLPLQIVFNDHWAEGISTSIKKGLVGILNMHPSISAVIIMVCDQPLLSAELISKLASEYINTGKPIIASKYNDVMGTPALFDRSLFGLLNELTGDRGAGKIINQNPDWVGVVPFDGGGLDIDREEDYRLYLKKLD